MILITTILIALGIAILVGLSAVTLSKEKKTNMKKVRGKSLKEWKAYSDIDKDDIPIRTRKYILCLEESIKELNK